MQVEITGTYNNAPYSDDANVWEVEPYGIEYDGLGDFPDEGDPSKLYVAKLENKIYRYDIDSGEYQCVGSDYNEIIAIVANRDE